MNTAIPGSSPFPRRQQVVFAGVCCAFFFSGFSGLVYETLWARLLTLCFGHTSVAVAAVLSAFMAGLSLGSFLGGKLADRARGGKLLLGYALLETAVAFSAVGSKYVIAFVEPLILRLGVVSTSLLTQSAVWFLAAFAIIIVPTFLMGATLPVLIKFLMHFDAGEGSAQATGTLYGINTLGAVIGTAVAGFYMIPRLGMQASFLCAGLLNLAAALIGFALLRVVPSAGPDLPARESAAENGAASAGTLRRCAGVLLLTGLAAMFCEVAWTRVFALVLGSSTYAFTIMLFTFLLGFSGGSMGFNLLFRRRASTMRGLAAVLAVTALVLLAYQPFFNLLPYLFFRALPLAQQSQFLLHAVQVTLCASVMIVPTFLMGLLFPWAIAVVNPARNATGAVVGFCYSANTAGNIVGSALAGLLLVPYIGAEQTLLLAVLVYALAVVLAAAGSSFGTWRTRLGAVVLFAGALLAGIALLPRWDPVLLSSGIFRYRWQTLDYGSDSLRYGEFVRTLHAPARLLYCRDGLSSTVTVSRDRATQEVYLRVNGKVDASSSAKGDMPTQLLIGYLPYLFHEQPPSSVLVVGLGSGVTVGAAASFESVRELECVEIEPALAEAARFFSTQNHNVLDDPRLRLIFADARQYLSVTGRKYDLIISEPSNPWIAGIANLFTKEAFTLSKRRLAEGGIFAQWFHGYSMDEKDFRMVLRTFAEVFPHVTVMNINEYDYLLLGSASPLQLGYGHLNDLYARNAVLRQDLASIGFDGPLSLVTATYLLGDAELRKFAAGAPVHGDDRPTLEFTAPRNLYRDLTGGIFRRLQSMKGEAFFDVSAAFGVTKEAQQRACVVAGEYYLRHGYYPQGFTLFNKALRLEARDARLWVDIARACGALRRHLQAVEAARKATAIDPGYTPAWLTLGVVYLAEGMEEESLKAFGEGLRFSRDEQMQHLYNYVIARRAGDEAAALREFGAALGEPPFSDPLLAQLREELQGRRAGVSLAAPAATAGGEGQARGDRTSN